MEFKEIAITQGIVNNLLVFKNKADFDKFAEKLENKEYLFVNYERYTDQNGEEVVAKELKLVFDKESKTYFGFEELLVSDEKMAELEASDEKEDETNKVVFVDEELKKAGVADETLVDLMKEFIEQNQVTSRDFVNDEQFKRHLLRKNKKLMGLWERKSWELREYLSDLAEQKAIQELLAEFGLKEAKRKDLLYQEIAGELSESEEYRSAKTESTKKAMIDELLYKKGITAFNSNDILRIKGKAEILLAKKKA